jgi:hypothetical protein
MKTEIQSRHSALQVLLLLSLCLVPQTTHADISVQMSSTPVGGGVFQYDFSVFNSGPDDVSTVSITDAPLGDLLLDTTLTAPPDFLASYDSGLGFVDFIEFIASFTAGSTVDGFQFQSEAAPPAFFTQFEALTVNGVQLRGSVQAVPDTRSTLAMASLSLMAVVLARRKL